MFRQVAALARVCLRMAPKVRPPRTAAARPEVGVLADVIPAGDPADGDGCDGAHGDQGIELGNAPRAAARAGTNPQQHPWSGR